MEGGETRPVGRPLKFQSVFELQVMIDEYFASCEEEIWIEEEDQEGRMAWKPSLDHLGNIRKRMVKPPTISGLAVHLGTDRKTLINYEAKEEFFNTIKAAKVRIEAFTEELLLTSKSAAGVIFNLKNNYGWTDKTEQEISGGLNNTNQNLDALTPAERRMRIDELNRRRGS